MNQKPDGTFLELNCYDEELINYPILTARETCSPQDTCESASELLHTVYPSTQSESMEDTTDCFDSIDFVIPFYDSDSYQTQGEEQATTSEETVASKPKQPVKWKWHESTESTISKSTRTRRKRHHSDRSRLVEVTNNHIKKRRVYDNMTTVLKVDHSRDTDSSRMVFDAQEEKFAGIPPFTSTSSVENSSSSENRNEMRSPPLISTSLFVVLIVLLIVCNLTFAQDDSCLSCDSGNRQVCGVNEYGELIAEPFRNQCDLIAHLSFESPNAFPLNGKCEVCTHVFEEPKCGSVNGELRSVPFETQCDFDAQHAREETTAILDVESWTCRPCSSTPFNPVCVRSNGILQTYYFTDECSIVAIKGVIEPKAAIRGRKCYIPGENPPNLCDNTPYPEPKCGRLISDKSLLESPVADDCQMEVLLATATNSAYIVNGKCVDNLHPCTTSPVCGIHNGIVRPTAFKGDCDAKANGYTVTEPGEATIKGTSCYQCNKKNVCVKPSDSLVLMDDCQAQVQGLLPAVPSDGKQIVIFGSSSECRECNPSLKNKCATSATGQIEPVADQCEAFNQGWELVTSGYRNRGGVCYTCDEANTEKKCASVNGVLTPLTHCERVEFGVEVEINSLLVNGKCQAIQPDCWTPNKQCGKNAAGVIRQAAFSSECDRLAAEHTLVDLVAENVVLKDDVCHKCPAGYNREGDKCVKGESCVGKLHKETKLTVDPNGFDAIRTCELKCPEGYQMEGEKCVKCFTGDQLCSLNGLQCPAKYIAVDTTPDASDPVLVTRRCVLNCRDGYIAEGEICIKPAQCPDYLQEKRNPSTINDYHFDEYCTCKDGYVLMGGHFWSLDTYCYSGAVNCSLPYHHVEVVNVDNNPQVRRGACVLKCPTGYTRSSNHCFKGPTECPQLPSTAQASFTRVTVPVGGDEWLSENKCELTCSLAGYKPVNQYDVTNAYCEQDTPSCLVPKVIVTTTSGLLKSKSCECPVGSREVLPKIEAMLSGAFWSFTRFETGEVTQNYGGQFANHKLQVLSDGSIFVALSGGVNTYVVKVLRSRSETPYPVATCGPDGKNLKLMDEAQAQGWTIRPGSSGAVWGYVVPPASYLQSSCVKGDDPADCLARGAYYSITVTKNPDQTITNTCTFTCPDNLKKLPNLNKCLEGPDTCARHQKEVIVENNNKVTRTCVSNCRDGYIADDAQQLCVKNSTCPPSFDGVSYEYESQVEDFHLTNVCRIKCPTGFVAIRDGPDATSHYCIQRATCQLPRVVSSPTTGTKRFETCVCAPQYQSYNDTVKCYAPTDNFKCEPVAYFDRAEVAQSDGSYKILCSFKCPRGERVPQQNKCIIGRPCLGNEMEQITEQPPYDATRTCVDDCEAGFQPDDEEQICIKVEQCPFEGVQDGVSWYYTRVTHRTHNKVDECRIKCPSGYDAVDNEDPTTSYCIKRASCPVPFVVKAPYATGFKREESCECPPSTIVRHGKCYTNSEDCPDDDFFDAQESQDPLTKLYTFTCQFTCANLPGSEKVTGKDQCIEGPTSCPDHHELVQIAVNQYHIQRKCQLKCAAGFTANENLKKCVRNQPCPANAGGITYKNDLSKLDPIDDWQAQFRCVINCPPGYVTVQPGDVSEAYCLIPTNCTAPQTTTIAGSGIERKEICECPEGLHQVEDKCLDPQHPVTCPDPEFFDQTYVRDPATGLYTIACTFVCRGDRRKVEGQNVCRQGPIECDRHEIPTIKSENQYLETVSCSANCPPGYEADEAKQLCVFVETCPPNQPSLGISFTHIEAPSPINIFSIIKKCILVCQHGEAVQAADLTLAYCKVTPTCPPAMYPVYPVSGIIRQGQCVCPTGTTKVERSDGIYCYDNPDYNCPAEDTYGFFIKKSTIHPNKTRSYYCEFSCPQGLTQMPGKNICVEGDLSCDGDHYIMQSTTVNPYYIRNKCVSACDNNFIADPVLKKCVQVETCPDPENGVTYTHKLVNIDQNRAAKVCVILCPDGTTTVDNDDIEKAYCVAPPAKPCVAPMTQNVPTTGKLRTQYCQCPAGLDLWRDKCYTPGDRACPSEQFFIRREVINSDGSVTVVCDFNCESPRRILDAQAQLCIEGEESCPDYKIEMIVDAGQYLRRRECIGNCTNGYVADDNIGRCVKIEDCPPNQNNVTFALVRVDESDSLMSIMKCKIDCPDGYIPDESSPQVTQHYCHAKPGNCNDNDLLVKIFPEDQGILREGVCTCVAGYQTVNGNCIKGPTDCPNERYYKYVTERVSLNGAVYYQAKCEFHCPAGYTQIPGEEKCIDKPSCPTGHLSRDDQDPSDPFLVHRTCILKCDPPYVQNGAYCLHDTDCPHGQTKVIIVSETDPTKKYAICQCPDNFVQGKVFDITTNQSKTICVRAPVCETPDVRPFALFLAQLKARLAERFSLDKK